MSRVLCAVGQVARQPYRIAKIERNVYSAEELCYLLSQSARLLDVSIMDPDLVDWLEQQCGLPELAGQLRPTLGKERDLSGFIDVILSYVGFITPEREDRTRQILQSGEGMETFAQRISRADFLAGNARPYEAIEEYEAVLRDLPEPEREMRTKVLSAEGKIYAGLFRFRQAADCYEKASALTADDDVYGKFLAAMRLSLSGTEYLDFVAEHPEAGNASLELENRVDGILKEYESTQSGSTLAALRRYKDEGLETNYEIALHQEIQKIKDEYVTTQGASE